MQELYLDKKIQDQIKKAQETSIRGGGMPEVHFVDYDVKNQDVNTVRFLLDHFPPYEMVWWHQIAALWNEERYIWMKRDEQWMPYWEFYYLMLADKE